MGIDQSLTSTGVVVFSPWGHVLRTGTLKYPLASKKGRPITEAMRVERLLNIANDLVRFAREFQIIRAVMEGFAFGKAERAHHMGELSGVIKTQLFLTRKLIPVQVPPATARKDILGYGNASKEDTQHVLKSLEIPFDTPDEADAIVLGLWGFVEMHKEAQDGQG